MFLELCFGALYLLPFTFFNKILVGGHTTPLLFRPKLAQCSAAAGWYYYRSAYAFPDSSARGGVWG